MRKILRLCKYSTFPGKQLFYYKYIRQFNQVFYQRRKKIDLDLCVRTGGGKPSENRGADSLKTYSAHRYGWHRLRSMRQEKLRDQATQLRLRQSLFQSQRMSPDFYFFQASFRSRLNHSHLRAEALSKRCPAVFCVHPTGSPHSQIQIQLNPMSRLATLYASDDTFLPERPGRFIVCPRMPYRIFI